MFSVHCSVRFYYDMHSDPTTTTTTQTKTTAAAEEVVWLHACMHKNPKPSCRSMDGLLPHWLIMSICIIIIDRNPREETNQYMRCCCYSAVTFLFKFLRPPPPPHLCKPWMKKYDEGLGLVPFPGKGTWDTATTIVPHSSIHIQWAAGR